MHTPNLTDVRQLVKLAESPALATVLDVDLLESGVIMLGVAIDVFSMQLQAGEGGPHGAEKIARVQAAWEALYVQRDIAKWSDGVAEKEDAELQCMMFSGPMPTPWMH